MLDVWRKVRRLAKCALLQQLQRQAQAPECFWHCLYQCAQLCAFCDLITDVVGQLAALWQCDEHIMSLHFLCTTLWSSPATHLLVSA